MSSPKKPKRENYFKGYDTLYRWFSYWWQIDAVTQLDQKKILEVGVGNGTVSDYLKKHGFEVTTGDINPRLKPDRVVDVAALPFKDHSYDLVLCCEVLEHLPFAKVKKAFKEMNRVTKKYAVISIFAANLGASFIAKIPLLRLIHFHLKVPLFWQKHNFDGDHYWAIGKKKYPVSKVRRAIRESGFKIIEESFPPLNLHHHFFILEKE